MDRGLEFNSWKLLCTIGDAAPQENFYDPKEICPSPVSTQSGSTAIWWRVRRFPMLCPWRCGVTRSFWISTSSISLKVISSLDWSANRATWQSQWILLVSLMLNLNKYSASAQNHRCSTSPRSIPVYRENPQGSTRVKCIVNRSDNLYWIYRPTNSAGVSQITDRING